MMAVKNFIRPDHHNHFAVAHIGNIMRPAGYGFHNLGLVSGDKKSAGLITNHMAKPETRLASDNQKLLGFAVMIVFAAGYAGIRSKERELPAVRGFQEFCKYPSRVRMAGQVIDKPGGRQITDIGGIKCPGQAGTDTLQDQIVPAISEGADLTGQISERY